MRRRRRWRSSTEGASHRTPGDCARRLAISHTPALAGTSCDGDDLYNGEGLCDDAGTDAPGTPLEPGGNPYTLDACDQGFNVVHVPSPTGTSREDGNPCNGAESCDSGGTCVAGSRRT